jgi:hypothetical protein
MVKGDSLSALKLTARNIALDESENVCTFLDTEKEVHSKLVLVTFKALVIYLEISDADVLMLIGVW